MAAFSQQAVNKRAKYIVFQMINRVVLDNNLMSVEVRDDLALCTIRSLYV